MTAYCAEKSESPMGGERDSKRYQHRLGQGKQPNHVRTGTRTERSRLAHRQDRDAEGKKGSQRPSPQPLNFMVLGRMRKHCPRSTELRTSTPEERSGIRHHADSVLTCGEPPDVLPDHDQGCWAADV